MPITAKAQGKTFTFPDGTPPEAIGAAIDEYFANSAPAEIESRVEGAELLSPQATENLSPDQQRALLEARQAQQSILPASQRPQGPSASVDRAQRFAQLQQDSPELAALIESMSPAEKAAVGFQGGLRKVARGAGKIVGADLFSDVNSPAMQALGDTSLAAQTGEALGSAAPFAAAGPLTGTVGRGFTATRGGATIVPEVTSAGGRIAAQSGIGAAEGASIAAGEDRGAGEVALAAGLGGAIGGGAELGASRLARGADQLPRQLVEEGEELLRRLPSKGSIAKAASESAPTVDQLFSASKEIFNKIDDAGITIKPNAYTGLTRSIRKDLEKSGLDKVNTPQAFRAVERLEELVGQQPTFNQLNQIRETAQVAAGNLQNKKEMALGATVINKIDEFLSNADSRFISGGENVGKELKVARDLWGRARRSQMVNEAIDKAREQASGFENGIRVQFRSILNNQKKSKLFSAEEKAAMKKVVQGSPSANMAKFIGRFGINEQQATSQLGAAVGAFGGAQVFGPAGAVIVPAIGQVSKGVARRLTEKNAKFADQVIRAGSNADRITRAYLANTPKAKRSAEELSELLMRPDIKIDDVSSDLAIEAAKLARERRNIIYGSSASASIATSAAASEDENL